MSLRKRPDWSRRLPRPLTIPGIMTLATLADVRALIEKHLPKECRERSTWCVVADDLEAAARDVRTMPANFAACAGGPAVE